MSIQPVNFGGLGHPWVHRGVRCDDCGTSRIEGYRYKCEKCSDHDLCERCFRRNHKRPGHKFTQIIRDSSEFRPPLQIYYIVCHECGQAPIEGRCHRHKWRPNTYVCNSCFSKRPHSINAGTEWEVVDEPRISTICRTHSPVFHFHRHCESCGISPIFGPRFDALAFPEYSMCLICFDSKFVKGLVKNEDYLRIEKPEAHKVRQIVVYSCQNCGELPIDGPAYISKRLPDHALCLLCYMNIPRQQQLEFSRVDAPAQYGDPPLRSLPQLTVGTVSDEEYTRLAEEFKDFKEEKEATARVVASTLLNQAEELEKLRKQVEEAQRAASADDIRNLGLSEKSSELVKLQANYTQLAAAFEQLQVEKEKAMIAAADYTDLSLEIERRRVESAEAVKVSADYALQLKEQNEASALAKTEYDNIVQEVLSLKAIASDAARSNELEHTNLVQELERLKQEATDAAEAAKAAAEGHSALLMENERLKAEKDEAAEYASLSKELEALEGASDVKSSEEYLLLLKDFEELREEKNSLAGELESVKERAEVANLDSEERHSSLSKEVEMYKKEEGRVSLLLQEHARLEQELETMKETREQELNLKAEEHLSLLQEFNLYKQESGELERSKTQEFADMVQRCEKLLEDKAWLVEEIENVHKEKDEASKISSDNEEALRREIENLRQETDSRAIALEDEHVSLVQQSNKLKLEKEATEVLHDSLLRRFEKLQTEKEDESRSRSVEFTSIVAELEILKEENEDIKRTREADQSHLHDEIARLEEEREEALRDAADRCLKLKEEVDRISDEKDRELETSKSGHVSIVEEFEAFKREKGEAERKLEGQYVLVKDNLEQFQREKEEMAKKNSELAQKVEVLRAESGEKEKVMRDLEEDYSSLLSEADQLRAQKEAEATLVSNLTLELEKLDLEMEANKREQEEHRFSSTQAHSTLKKDLERSKQEAAKKLREKDEEFARALDELETLEREHEDLRRSHVEKAANLTREIELMRTEKVEKEAKIANLILEMDAERAEGEKKVSILSREVDAERAEGEKKVSILSREMELVRTEYEEKDQANKKDSSRLRDELEKLKPFAFLSAMPDIGLCAQVAIATCGAMVQTKKIHLERGFAKSQADTKTLKEAEKFIADAARQLDDTYDFLYHEARLVKDSEASNYYTAQLRPELLQRARITQHLGSSELAAARKKFGS